MAIQKPRGRPIPNRHPKRKANKGRKAERAKKARGESVRYTFLESIGNDIGNDAILGSRVNVANRKVNLSYTLGKVIGRTKIGTMNVLAL